MLAHFLRQEFSLFYQHPLAVIIALLKGFLLVSISCLLSLSQLLAPLYSFRGSVYFPGVVAEA